MLNMIRQSNQFGRPEIPSKELISSDIPPICRDYSNEIVEFALTFDGYLRYDFDKLFRLKDRTQSTFSRDRSLPRTLDRMRACLFAQQRMWRDSGSPDEQSLEFIQALVERIRQIVEGRQAGG